MNRRRAIILLPIALSLVVIGTHTLGLSWWGAVGATAGLCAMFYILAFIRALFDDLGPKIRPLPDENNGKSGNDGQQSSDVRF